MEGATITSPHHHRNPTGHGFQSLPNGQKTLTRIGIRYLNACGLNEVPHGEGHEQRLRGYAALLHRRVHRLKLCRVHLATNDNVSR
jgi:hypothetical protein